MKGKELGERVSMSNDAFDTDLGPLSDLFSIISKVLDIVEV